MHAFTHLPFILWSTIHLYILEVILEVDDIIFTYFNYIKI